MYDVTMTLLIEMELHFFRKCTSFYKYLKIIILYS